ncbi:MAG: M20 family metallo-hydrolase [Methanomassiliicoccales archaeon]
MAEAVEHRREDMIRGLKEMISIPAISPESGGEGEFDRSRFIESLLKEAGITKIKHYDAPDRKAKGGVRPNVVAALGDKPSLWIVSHMDTVPPGDRSLWKSDPFAAVVRNGRIIGRGAEDNGQSLIASIYAAIGAMDAGLSPSVQLLFASDEELGSEKGIGYMAAQHVFKKGDEFLVPDAGSADGSAIEIAEKSSLWLRITTEGVQTHASHPSSGLNALVASSRFLVFIRDYLYSRYPAEDQLFSPVPHSTFEPTKRLANVENVNTIPGTDEFYIDARILPSQSLRGILGDVRRAASLFTSMTGAKIRVSVFRKSQAAQPTSSDASVCSRLASSLETVRGVKPVFVGIGGGTCANIVRALGLPAAVWETECGQAHNPNEFALIDNMVADAKIMASMMV